MIARITAALLVTSSAVFCQTVVPPAFEVASIKVSNGQRIGGMSLDRAQISIYGFALAELISWAYGIRAHEFSGPAWLSSESTIERFDIVAKLPAGATEKQAPEMMQTLLAERFQLKAHRETKQLDAFALLQARGGLKMKLSDTKEEPGQITIGGDGKVHLNAASTGMKQFTTVVARFLGRPVVDMTGLTGNYQLELIVDREVLMARGEAPRLSDGVTDSGTASIFTQVQELGLRLESRKAPVELLVVDSVSAKPSDN